jgi:hypothetical protein
LIEGLEDTSASMLIMVDRIVRKLRIMHMVSGTKSFKTASHTIIRALGKIIDLPFKVGNIQCNMVFLIIDTYNYDILLGLDFLMKIETIVDVEKGVIKVQNSPRMVVELFPLTLVNMLQLVLH